MDNIRKCFVAMAQQSADRFHPKDVERVKTEDWTVERFVLVNKTEEAALKALVKAMEWRKSFGVNDFTEDYFPKELYKMGEFTVYCKDKEGRPIIWWRFARHHKSSELGTLIRQFLIYNIEKLDQNTKNQGWGLVSDTTDSGLSNTEMDFSNFIVDVLQNYYPRGVKYLASVDLPWILNAFAKAVMAFMNEELKNCVKFVSKEELTQYMDTQFIPRHLNGTYDKEMTTIPSGVKTLEQLTHTKFSADQIKKIMSTFKDELK